MLIVIWLSTILDVILLGGSYNDQRLENLKTTQSRPQELQEMSLLLDFLDLDQGSSKVLTSDIRGGDYFKKHCGKLETLSKIHSHTLR